MNSSSTTEDRLAAWRTFFAATTGALWISRKASTACRRFLFCAMMVGSPFGINHSQSLAQASLYDNLNNVRSDGRSQWDWLTAGGSSTRFAQQFLLGDNANIDQVTVSLLRPESGATGSLRFELWRDNGSGQPIRVTDPTGKVADLGEIVDVTQIPVGRFGEFTFDNLILGLAPNQPYWIVTDNQKIRDIVGPNRSVGIALAFSGDPNVPDPPGYDATAGTFGAAHLHAYRNQDPYWNNLNNFFGLEHFYQAMKVEARADSSLVDIDTLSSAVRQGLTDSKYDINQDGLVNTDDRTYWIQHTDHGNAWFGDANLDGEFNSADLTLVFQSGEYDDNITLNSSWADGDWDGNGDFESGDLIVAFQDGGYEMGPQAAVNAVPEPTCGMLLAIGAIAICRLRKR